MGVGSNELNERSQNFVGPSKDVFRTHLTLVKQPPKVGFDIILEFTLRLISGATEFYVCQDHGSESSPEKEGMKVYF